jgi:hypothetical protein
VPPDRTSRRSQPEVSKYEAGGGGFIRAELTGFPPTLL